MSVDCPCDINKYTYEWIDSFFIYVIKWKKSIKLGDRENEMRKRLKFFIKQHQNEEKKNILEGAFKAAHINEMNFFIAWENLII